MFPLAKEVSSLVTPLVPLEGTSKLHLNMEYDQDPFPTWANTPPLSCDSLDDKSSSWQVILEFMESSYGEPLDVSSLLELKKVESGKQNLESIKGKSPQSYLEVPPMR